MNGVTLTSDTLGVDCCATYAFRVVVHRSLLGMWAQSPATQIAEVFSDQGFTNVTAFTDASQLPAEVPADFRTTQGAEFPDFVAWIKADWAQQESKAIDRDQGGPVPLTVLDARVWPSTSAPGQAPQVFPIRFTGGWSQVFLPPPGSTLGIRGVALRLKCDPLALMQAFWHESGLNPAAYNANGGASGINQLMPDFLKSSGWKLSPAEYRKLSAEDQLPYVENFLRPWAHLGLTSPGMVYALNYLPGRVAQRGTTPETVLTQRGDVDYHKLGKAFSYYDGNESLDFDKDGRITIGDLQNVALASWAKGGRVTAELECRVRTGGGCSPSSLPAAIAANGKLVGAGAFALAGLASLAYAWWHTS